MDNVIVFVVAQMQEGWGDYRGVIILGVKRLHWRYRIFVCIEFFWRMLIMYLFWVVTISVICPLSVTQPVPLALLRLRTNCIFLGGYYFHLSSKNETWNLTSRVSLWRSNNSTGCLFTSLSDWWNTDILNCFLSYCQKHPLVNSVILPEWRCLITFHHWVRGWSFSICT